MTHPNCDVTRAKEYYQVHSKKSNHCTHASLSVTRKRLAADEVGIGHLGTVIQHLRLHFDIVELVVTETDVHEPVKLVRDVRLALGHDALFKCEKSRNQAYMVSIELWSQILLSGHSIKSNLLSVDSQVRWWHLPAGGGASRLLKYFLKTPSSTCSATLEAS